MEILSLKFEMRQFLYQSSRIFTTCVSQTTGPWKMQSPTIEILWYGMVMLRIHSGQIFPESYLDKLRSLPGGAT